MSEKTVKPLNLVYNSLLEEEGLTKDSLPKNLKMSINGLNLLIKKHEKTPTDKSADVINKKAIEIADNIQTWIEESIEETQEAEAKKKEQEEAEAKKKEQEEAEAKKKEQEEAEAKKKEQEEAEAKKKEQEEAEAKKKEQEEKDGAFKNPFLKSILGV